jgi:hypothetical protein
VFTHLGLLLSIVIASMLLGACEGSIRYTRPVVETEGRYVKLDARYGYGHHLGYDGKSMHFTHPFSLGETEWAYLLAQVHIQLSKGFLGIGREHLDPHEAFTKSEQSYLAKYLAQAFEMARPDEWVVFYLSHPRQGESDSSVTEVTSGGLFLRETKLYLIFANYRYGVTMGSLLDQVRGDPLRPAGDHRYEFVPGTSQTTQEVKLWNLSQPLRAYNLELVLDYQTLLTTPLEGDRSPSSTLSIEARLERIQRLYEKGLLTEEEYQRKRQSLLDEL